MFYEIHSAFWEFIYISKCKHILKTVAKSCVEHDFNNTNLVTKVKEENFNSQLKSHKTKQLLTSIQVDIRIYLPLKVIYTSAFGLGEVENPHVYLIGVNNCIMRYVFVI